MNNHSHITNENINDSVITNSITQILANFKEYEEWKKELEIAKSTLKVLPKDKSELRSTYESKVSDFQGRIDSYEKQVKQLSDEIKVEEAYQKKALNEFEKLNFKEAIKILKSKTPHIEEVDEKISLKEEELKTAKLNISNHYYLLALATQTDYADNPNWFIDTCRYFESSIKSVANKENLFEYAKFLEYKNRDKAIKIYLRILDDFQKDLSLNWKGAIINNLAVIYSSKGEHQDAIAFYKKALNIYLELIKQCNKDSDKFKYADTLNNLGVMYAFEGNFEFAKNCYKESLRIFNVLLICFGEYSQFKMVSVYFNFAICFKYQKDLKNEIIYNKKAFKLANKLYKNNPKSCTTIYANALNLLGNNFESIGDIENSKKYYLKAYKILKKQKHLNIFEVSIILGEILNNLASVYEKQDLFEEVLKYDLEALALYEECYKHEPEIYKEGLCKVLSNLSVSYLRDFPNKKISNGYAHRTVELVYFHIKDANLNEHFNRACGVLLFWKENELSKLSNEKIIQLFKNFTKTSTG